MTLYQNCLDRSAPLNKMAARAVKVEKPSIDFSSLTSASILKKIIQECSLGDCPPKLLKLFHSVEQDGRQGYK